MPTTVTLRTSNVTAHVVEGSLREVSHDLFAHTRIAAFRLRNTTPVVPAMDDFVKLTKTDGTGAAFAGTTKIPTTEIRPVVPVEYGVPCQGWEQLLDGLNITTGMILNANTVDAVLVKDALDTFYAAVASSATHAIYPMRTDLPYKRAPSGAWSFRSLMDWIVGETGAIWWIEPSDKSFHYNDFQQFAPFILSDSPNGSTKRGYRNLQRVRDSVGRRVRVVVSDGAGNTTTCTDWDAWADINAKRSEEPGSPSERFPQLPTIVDSTLDTADKRKRRGFQALDQEKGREVISATVTDEGLAIGQQVDIVNASLGTGTAPHPWLEQWELGVTSTTEDLDTAMGRYMVTKVTQREVAPDKWEWAIEAGDPNEIMGALISRGSNR